MCRLAIDADRLQRMAAFLGGVFPCADNVRFAGLMAANEGEGGRLIQPTGIGPANDARHFAGLDRQRISANPHQHHDT